MSDDSPLVDTQEKNSPKDEIVGGRVVSPETLKTIAFVITLLAVVALLYYATTCYSGNTRPKSKKSKKSTSVECDFDVEKEVQKLRIKQDDFKARM